MPIRNTKDWENELVCEVRVGGAIVMLAMFIGVLTIAYVGGYQAGAYNATVEYGEKLQCPPQ